VKPPHELREPSLAHPLLGLSLSIDPKTLLVVDCNEELANALGASPLGRPWPDLIDAEYRDAAAETLATLRHRPEIKHVRLRILRSDGVSVPVIMAARRIDSGGDHGTLIQIHCRDISSLKQLDNIGAFSEMLSLGIALVDEKGCIIFANAAAEKMFGYERGDLENQPLEILVPSPLREGHTQQTRGFFHDPKTRMMAAHRELYGSKKDGSPIAVQIGLSSIRLGEKRYAVASIADITERKSIERKVRDYEAQRTAIFSAGVVGDFTWAIERDEVEASATVFKLHGAAPISGPVPAAWFRARRHADAILGFHESWLNPIATGQQLSLEFCVDGDDGVSRWLACHGLVVRDNAGQPSQLQGLIVDITQRKHAEIERGDSEIRRQKAEEKLRAALDEKDALLREIHHRVKNNLQIVSSLLSMQAASVQENSTAAAALRDSERRIASMATIHEQLYGTEDMRTLDFGEQALKLTQNLFASMAEGPRISCEFDISPVDLTIHQAIPCALILNELLTNALKYAYPKGTAGKITVHLSHREERVHLAVSDRGIGLPATIDPAQPKTLGLEIVQVLTNQLDGELRVVRSHGASFTVSFPRQSEEPTGMLPRSRAAAAV
jgi:PAS domain S-box-containing protein